MAEKIIPPNRNDFITERGDMTQRTARFFELLAGQSNETVTIIEETASDIQNTVPNVDAQGVSEDEAFHYFAPKEISTWRAVTPTQAYYAVGWDYVEAQTGIIYLPEFPAESEQVIVSSGYSSNVIVLGNGNNIKVRDEESSITISQKGTSLHFIYFVDGGYWRIV